jgi:hypothetical protein
VVFAAKFSPPGCATEPASTVAWIQRGKDRAGAAGYVFKVEPNPTRAPRQGAIRVGDLSLVINQAQGRFAPFAAAPGRVEFTVSGKTAPKQTVTAWSEESGVTFAARTATPWLTITAMAKGKAGAQRFTVELAPAALEPGVHEGSIEITAPGVVNEPVRILVVVTIADKKK